MTDKLFIRIPQQRHGEREGTETERERRKTGWSTERGRNWKRYGRTRGEGRHVGKIASRTKRRRKSTLQQDEKIHRKWIVLSTNGQMRGGKKECTHQEQGVSKGSFQRSASDRLQICLTESLQKDREREK